MLFIETLFVFALAIGIIDLWILIRMAGGFGIVLIVISQVITAAIGLWWMRKLDFNLFFFLDVELKNRQPIIRELWEEAWLLTAACLLIMPGLLTDLIGALGLMPPLRRWWFDYFGRDLL
jgi:UPF0716 protein FxsA